ncbi:hypothetical protein HDA45_006449 [Amycolatopsis umgeniensis]|uniref:DUF4238 domain-containing protein n=1 Tax=Amycolatopsis umgeniensis TaxID=336628 RepID=A0A841BCR7_9PSEU|nr:hypothetical protein [Amycolatopsis umgeniensis]
MLKNFSFKDANGGDTLIPYNVRTKRELRPLGIGGCGKILHFIRYASQSLEDLWKSSVEDHLHQVSASIQDRSILGKPDLVTVVKDCIALHLVRSLRYLEVHSASIDQAQRALGPDLIGRFKQPLSRLFLAKYGLYPAGDEALECVVDEFFAEWRRVNSDGLMERQDVEQAFERIRGGFTPLQINVMYAPAGSEFLISDSPAFTYLFDATGERFTKIRSAVGDSNGVGMPIARDCFVTTAPDLGMGEVPAKFVDYLNMVQMEIAYEHVYYRQGSPLASFVSSAAAP